MKNAGRILIITGLLLLVLSAGFYILSDYVADQAVEELLKREASDSTSSSQEQLEQIKEKISAADKVYLTSTVLTKLDPSTVQDLLKMAEGGLTGEEAQKAEIIIKQNFSAEELQKLQGLYAKYASSISPPPN